MLTRRMQVQVIADRLAGLPINMKICRKAKHFAEPWKTIWEALESANGNPPQDVMVKALESNEERGEILKEIMYARPGSAFGNYPSLEAIEGDLTPIEWLWKGWIPLGMVTLMGAAPGVGKSFLCLDLARRVIHAERWPDGQDGTPRANVLYVDAENVPQIMNARAKSWRMNRSKLFLMTPDLDDILDFSQEKYRDRLTQMVAQIEPGLVIVDSLSSISSKGENNVEDVRQLLSFLNMIAREYVTAMVIIHHLRKHTGAQMQLFDLSLEDFRGSSHIAAMARSVIGVSIVQTQANTDRNGPRKVEIIKTNLGPYPDGLGFQFAPGAEEGVVLRWDMKAPAAYKEPTQLDECEEWLEDFLKEIGKPIRPKDVIKAGKEEGFSQAMIYRARKTLRVHIKNTEGRQSPDNAWDWSEVEVQEQDDEDDDMD